MSQHQRSDQSYCGGGVNPLLSQMCCSCSSTSSSSSTTSSSSASSYSAYPCENCSAILQVMKTREMNCCANPNYISQLQATHGFSAIEREEVIEWIFGCAEELEVGNETASIATNLFDRYLSVVANVAKSEMQILAAACLLISSKMNEVDYILPIEMCTLACHIFTEQQLHLVELELLRILNWSVNPVTAHTFLQAFLTLPSFAKYDKPFGRVAELFADMSCADYGLLLYKPSVVAAACLLCSLDTYGVSLQPSLRLMVDYQLLDALDDVQNCRARLNQLYNRGAEQQDCNNNNNNNNNIYILQPDTPRSNVSTLQILERC